MKLVATIELEFKKILLMSLGISLVAIATFSFFSAKESVEKATAFIESHISLLTEAEVNFQNVSEIDRRVRQVYESWIKSQGIDLRIEVLIDNKLVAKAGQLQKFGPMSLSTNREVILPSGNHVKLVVDADLSYLTVFVLITTFCIGLFLLLCFWQLRKRMRRSLSQISQPLENRISWLQTVSSQLPESLAFETKASPSSIEELANLDESFNTFISRLRRLETQVAEKSFSEGRVKMAEQVAHSLKGAIGTLDLLLENNTSLPAAVKREIQQSIQKMRNVSSGMLSLRKSEERKTLSQMDEQFDPSQIIEEVVNHKKKLHPNISIERCDNNVAHVTLFGPRIDFETMISNIIDNAIEALPGKGWVRLTSYKIDESIILKISDNGKGIHSEVLPLLMNEGVTFKANGNGLGLYHAKNTVEAMKGTITIASELSKGTSVDLSLPIFSEKVIELSEVQQLVIVDDDIQIHRSWDLMLSPYRRHIDVIHIYSDSEFEEWISEHGAGVFGKRFYIFDYDLKSQLSGIDLIKKFDLRLESIVISWMADDKMVIDEAQQAKVRLWNKSTLHKIKLNVTKMEIQTETPLEAVNI